jgi:hypothetical protein
MAYVGGTLLRAVLLGVAVCAIPSTAGAAQPETFPGARGWVEAGVPPIRGLTIGPIENARHPGRGYGSRPYARAVYEAKKMGATWVSLTPFGRVLDLNPTGIDLSFEAPFEKNRRDVIAAIRLAHAEGLKVLLVPHLWVESGEWRALMAPEGDVAWARWARAYAAFVAAWARVAEEGRADMLSVGVEQRSFVTTARAPLYADVFAAARGAYQGPLTYSGNWDDVEDTVTLGELDVIGINAFYPLADREGASLSTLLAGGKRVADKVRALAERWQRPVMFTEIGYTARPDPAVRPWEWPDAMKGVKVDEDAQADAYLGLLAPVLDVDAFVGFFVWRLYADPDDTSQEDEWGFSPRGKLAELVVRDAFRARWAADGPRLPGSVPARIAADEPGFYDAAPFPPWW